MGEAGYDSLHKLQPGIDALNSRQKEVYIQSSVMALDESIVTFKGRSSMKQYMPMSGYRVWCLADSESGIVSQCDIRSERSDT
jgi:hypothetical protein